MIKIFNPIKINLFVISKFQTTLRITRSKTKKIIIIFLIPRILLLQKFENAKHISKLAYF
jgi:hypothetical protein